MVDDSDPVDEPDPINKLPFYDQLLHGIGLVNQAHVELELQLRLLYQALAGIPRGTIVNAPWGPAPR